MIEKLKEVGLKATPQRLSILRELNKKNHPTIDDLYRNIKEDYPSISLATVYKNLNMLKDEGLVLEITPLSASEKSKYDIYLEPHIHIICTHCGKIEDYYINGALEECKILLQRVTKKDIKNANIIGTTICEECRNKLKQ